MARYETYLWMELIALDNQVPDMGVKAYLDSLGFKPDGISIFMWGPDFVHCHHGLQEDEFFPPDVGAYMDTWFDKPKYQGPPWSKWMLKRAIEEFHRHGVKVLFSVFPSSLGNRWHREWIYEHPEIANVTVRNMQPATPVIHILKRFADGRYYEDFLLDKVSEVIEDYDFDGWHLGDGYNHGWFQLCHGDYSDDMIDQFLADGGGAVVLPEEYPAHCDDDPERLQARAAYIWRSLRREWIDFHRRRFRTYFTKVVQRMHAMGKRVTLHTCWTRDPVEALYRYGIDYRELPQLGFDRIVIETVGSGGEYMDFCWRARFHVPFYHVICATALLTKAAAPEGKFIFLNGVQDLTEGWSSLRHAPAALEREIITYSNLYCCDGNGVLQRCFDGLQVCLAASIRPHEWEFLHSKWEIGFELQPQKLDGMLLVWSDSILEAELDFYLETRRCLTACWLYELLAGGARIAGTVNIKDIDRVDAPLLVLNPGLLPEEEQSILHRKRSRPLFAVGEIGSFECDGWGFADTNSATPARFRCLNAPQLPGGDWNVPASKPEELPEDLMGIPEPPSFFDEQFYRRASAGFLNLTLRAFDAVLRPVIHIQSEETPDQKFFHFNGLCVSNLVWRYLVTNENWRYILGDLTSDLPLKDIRIVNDFRGRPMRLEERTDGLPGVRSFVRIPPKGIGVLDIEFSEEAEEGGR